MAGSIAVGSAEAGAIAAESVVVGAVVVASEGFTAAAAGSLDSVESVGSVNLGSVDSSPACAAGLVSLAATGLFSVDFPRGSEVAPGPLAPGPLAPGLFPLILPGLMRRLGGRLDSASADGEFESAADSSVPVELLSLTGRVTPGASISHPLPLTVMEPAVP